LDQNIKFKKMTHYFNCLLILFFLSLAGCKTPEPETELPPTIIVGGQNPLKTGIYMTFIDDSVRVSDRFGIDTFYSESNIDTAKLGYYQIQYFVQSLSGMTAEAQRDVWVVVKPESMRGVWDVAWRILPSGDSLSFIDSLGVENTRLIIHNFNNIPDLKIKLSLAANLQDSVYIFEQYSSDSLYCVFGNGTINERARNMILNYFIVEENDTTKYRAIYSREKIPTQ